MTNEEKQLLIKDLTARLPYGVKVSYPRLNLNQHNIFNLQGFSAPFHLDIERDSAEYYGFRAVPIEDIKPYLRPMSSMTDEEVKDLIKVKILSKYGKEGDYFGFNNIKSIKVSYFSSELKEWFCDVTYNTIDGEHTHSEATARVNWDTTLAEIDWLNEHHFDFRGLIENGFALKAPKGMYNRK